MRLTLAEAHLLCAVIAAADLLARALRIRWYFRGLGAELSLRRAFTATAWGDAAAGLTPLRFGGEAAKFAGLIRGGLRPGLAVVGLGLEALITYPLVALFGVLLAWRFAPAWWETTRPIVGEALVAGWPWLVAVLGLMLVGAWLALRWHRAFRTAPGTERPRLRDSLRRLPAWPLAAGALLSLFNVAGRTAILPLLALTLPEHPPFGVMLLGSFALLYSQLILPTPAGAGAVDFGFLAGVAGNLGPGAGGLLLAWRFYTVGLGTLIGAALAARLIGWAALRRLLAVRSPPA